MYAEDFHRPSFLICASPRPTAAAVVAAPMRKLYPLYSVVSTPWRASVSRIDVINMLRDKGDPFDRIKSGPGTQLRTAKLDKTAETGQSKCPVQPRDSVIPLPKGSVLLCLRCTRKKRGLTLESTAISPSNSTAGVIGEVDGHVNSPQRRKPKKARQHAAHSIESDGSMHKIRRIWQGKPQKGKECIH